MIPFRSRRTASGLAAAILILSACTGAGSPSPSGAASPSASAASPSASAGGSPSASASGGTASGKVALLLPERQTARYEAADRPFFEARFGEVCPGVGYAYNNANQDATAQQQQAEAAITDGATVLVLDPVDGESAGVIVNNAKDQGVKVISYDRLIKGGSTPDYYISFDNERVGQLQGQALLDKLTADGVTNPRLIWINGSPTDNNATLFARGAHSILDGKVQVLKEDAMPQWKPEEAQQLMEAAIAEFGSEFDGVYVANDGGAGGAIAAMKANGVDPKTKPTTGQDAELAAIQRIIAGEQYMTVYKAIQPEAAAAADLACSLVKGETPAADTVPVNNETADIPSVLLTPIAVTLEGAVEGTESILDTVVADEFFGADSIAQICTADFAAACAAAGIQ